MRTEGSAEKNADGSIKVQLFAKDEADNSTAVAKTGDGIIKGRSEALDQHEKVTDPEARPIAAML